MDTQQARELYEQVQRDLREQSAVVARLREEVSRLRDLEEEIKRKEQLVEALRPFAEVGIEAPTRKQDDADDADETETLTLIENEAPKRRRVVRRVRGGTAELLENLLRDVGHPMSPSDVLEELERRGEVPESAAPSNLIGVTLQRLNDRDHSPVRRVETGLYSYVGDTTEDPSPERGR